MEESYIQTIKRDDIEIGEIWLEGDGYSAKPYFGDMGHAGFDKLNEAIEDVNDLYDQYQYDRQQKIKSILVEYKDELMRRPKRKK